MVCSRSLGPCVLGFSLVGLLFIFLAWLSCSRFPRVCCACVVCVVHLVLVLLNEMCVVHLVLFLLYEMTHTYPTSLEKKIPNILLLDVLSFLAYAECICNL
jgi:hypothetical protein